MLKPIHFADFPAFQQDLFLVEKWGPAHLFREAFHVTSSVGKEFRTWVEAGDFVPMLSDLDGPVHYISGDTKAIVTIHTKDTQGYCAMLNDASVAAAMKVKLKELRDTKPAAHNKLNFICKNSHGLYLMEKTLKHAKTDIPLENYAFAFPYEKIKSQLKAPSPGIMLFSGPPGTGKSFFIRKLIQDTGLKFVYIPVDTAGVLSDPGFMSFAVEELEDSVLVVEDAETVLMDRQKSGNSAAATILNLSDGILGEILGTKIITTVNVRESIDKALLRKGRLLAQITFDPLPVPQANDVLKRINSAQTVDKPTTLADLYHLGEDNGHETIEQKIGF